MLKSCPISIHRIDSNLVRLIAFQVCILGLAYLFTKNIYFIVIILLDFSVRSLKIKKLSLFSLIGNSIISFFKIKPKMSDEAPKRFAMNFGLIILTSIILAAYFHYPYITIILVASLIACAFLEAAFDYCVGCKIYYLIQYMYHRLT